MAAWGIFAALHSETEEPLLLECLVDKPVKLRRVQRLPRLPDFFQLL
jgi:hypothetical protein